MANSEQALGGVNYNPFSVDDSALTITAQRTPPNAMSDAQGCPWIGGHLMSNTHLPQDTFDSGYFEYRVRIPTPGKGMFPALWFYSAYGANPPNKAQCEIDLLEIFADPSGTPWHSTLHLKNSSGQGPDQPVLSRHDDTTGWHTYGLYRTTNQLTFYRDREVAGTVTGANADYFSGYGMSIRMEFSMNALFFPPQNMSDSSTPDRLTIDIDYVRQYDHPL